MYFETDKEDDLKKVGLSKERRVDPQARVGMLVDRDGLSLQVGGWECNKAETRTIIPMVTKLLTAHQVYLKRIVVVADAGMLWLDLPTLIPTKTSMSFASMATLHCLMGRPTEDHKPRTYAR